MVSKECQEKLSKVSKKCQNYCQMKIISFLERYVAFSFTFFVKVGVICEFSFQYIKETI